MSDKVAKKVLLAWTERLRPLWIEESLASWDMNGNATPENAARMDKAREATEKAAHDPVGFEKVGRALEEGVADPLLARGLRVLKHELLPYQGPEEDRKRLVHLETKVEQTYSKVRGHVGGKAVSDNEIATILKTSEDVALRAEAWRASKEVGAAVAADVRELARLRNRIAKALGYPDHYALSLARQDLPRETLEAFLAAMDAGTEKPFAAYKAALDARLARRFHTKEADLRPWHYEDPFFQEAPEAGRPPLDPLFASKDLVDLTNRTFDGVGLDVRSSIARSDLLPREGKCQHAFCTHIDREGDVRVLCNNRPDERWAGTMLHEYGHAVYDLEIDRALPWMLRTPPHMASTEAIAMLFGRLSKDEAWLVPFLGLSKPDAARISEAVRVAFSEGMLVMTRWVLVMVRFEQALYADPERDLDTLWWDLVEKFQRVRRPDGRKAPDWAAKIHVATAPVYYHSYLMGECIASQVSHAIRTTTGKGLVANPAAGPWLREKWFRPGSSLPWNDHLAAATGRPLDASVLLSDMGIGPAA